MKKLIFLLFVICFIQANSQININIQKGRDYVPNVTAFTIPSTGNDLTVTISSFTATDDKGIIGYKITETSVKPTYTSSGWSVTAPTTYTFSGFGNKTLYAWVKDNGGHVSSYKSDGIVLTQIDATPPAMTAFIIPATATSLTISIISFTGTDNVAVTGYRITESATPPTTGWTGTAPATYTFTTEGTKTLYAWVRDAANNVSLAFTDQCVITLPDITKPIVATFSIPATSSSLTISITSFTATDNKGVTGYKLTEVNTEPISGWVATAPTTYTFATEGTKTLYAWAKDAAGNISLSLSDQITVTITPPPPPPANYYSTSYPGTEYYVSNTGSDSNNGTSEATPWLTIAKVNSRLFNAGDAILFNSVDSFPGQLTISSSGSASYRLTVGAYGINTSKPKIYGSEVVTGWTLHSGNIYKATVDKIDIKQLFEDGIRVSLARYPKTGFADITTANSTTQLTSTEITSQATDYYKDATLFYRSTAFSLESRTVTASTAQTLTVAAFTNGTIELGRGFFLTNKWTFLTQAGEWYYDNSGNTLYLWCSDGTTPADNVVRVSTYDYGVTITNKNYITVKDLEILNSGINAVNITNGDYVTIDNNTINNPDLIGVHVPGNTSTYCTITNNTIAGANANAVRVFSANATISDNTISNIGLKAGWNKATIADNYDNNGTAIFSRNDNHTINYNRIENIGYDGINFQGLNTTVKYNYVNGACKVLDDGGGIYCFGSGTYPTNTRTIGSVIESNIVLNVWGNADGGLKSYGDGYGIYFDVTKSVTAKNNTIGGAIGGIFLNEGGLNVVRGNTIFDAHIHLFTQNKHETHLAASNIFYTTNDSYDWKYWSNEQQRLVFQLTNDADVDSNYYRAPYVETDIFPDFADYAAYKSATGDDTNSTYNGTNITGGYSERLIYNDTKAAKTFNLNGATAKDVYGATITTSFTLQKFTSKIVTGTSLNLIE